MDKIGIFIAIINLFFKICVIILIYSIIFLFILYIDNTRLIISVSCFLISENGLPLLRSEEKQLTDNRQSYTYIFFFLFLLLKAIWGIYRARWEDEELMPELNASPPQPYHNLGCFPSTPKQINTAINIIKLFKRKGF